MHRNTHRFRASVLRVASLTQRSLHATTERSLLRVFILDLEVNTCRFVEDQIDIHVEKVGNLEVNPTFEHNAVRLPTAYAGKLNVRVCPAQR